MEQLMGTGVALVTPFKNDFSVDYKALGAIVEHCLSGGVDYLVALGTTAESVTLSSEERRLVMQTIAKVNAGRVPLVVGMGGNNTQAVIDDLQTYDFSEFSAILSVSPYYNKPTQEGIFQHFKAIAKASPVPVILYNVPSRTGSNMLPETTLRLAHDVRNIVAIKEACGDMVQINTIIKRKPEDFLVISGDDFTALPTILAGGAGVISVLGQGLPSEFSRMVDLALQNKSDEAYEVHHALLNGMQLIFEEGNPAGIKTIFEFLGLSTAKVRLPLVEATPYLKQKIKAFLKSTQKEEV
ncbi:4-hydroxy-tetrahydrodipicolinate synthase [Allomuricauda sp. SCSIO 65647]|uniref:4-hydroxy-tetrahydrodipicolinate synthase n=1 Tax=Allomuricauda sp. SCSIO 65647 TaxID=2908843 RepID=UPI001F374739|nr:4-hydroxy-tetrahydrodipicolinate synthase [Muricauda sp. SCSIO 65647]UJH69333.1 4-hydroxy-tetrahydrodipicolinate synthase [Muricauda sp. SCSIO 65647]